MHRPASEFARREEAGLRTAPCSLACQTAMKRLLGLGSIRFPVTELGADSFGSGRESQEPGARFPAIFLC